MKSKPGADKSSARTSAANADVAVKPVRRQPVRRKATGLRPSVGQPVTAPKPEDGRLIIVACADRGWLDLVLEAVRRRFAHNAALAFVEPVSTRRLPAGGGIVMKPSGFKQLERIGGLALAWRCDARDYGHSIALLARLSRGETVVAGASADVAAEARSRWHDVTIVRLTTNTDRMRASLSPRACLSRLAGSRPARAPGLERLLAENADITVHDNGDFARAVRDLGAAIAALTANRTPGVSRARGVVAGTGYSAAL